MEITPSSRILSLLVLVASTRGQLTLRLYNNSALAGEPLSISTVDTLSFSVPLATASAPLSLEASGTLTYPAGTPACFENDQGCYTFDCAFHGASYAFLWVDDHLVCQAGAYAPKPNTFDGSAGNPLRVLRRKAVAVRLHLYYNGVPPVSPPTSPTPASAPLPAGYSEWSGQNIDTAFSRDMRPLGGDLTDATVADCAAACDTKRAQGCVGFVRQQGDAAGARSACYLRRLNPSCTPADTCRAALQPNAQYRTYTRDASCAGLAPTPAPGTAVGVDVRWAPGRANGTAPPAASFAPLPAAALVPALSAAEQKRAALRTNLTAGWGCWANSVLDIVLLPEAARLTVALCQLSNGGACVASTDPSDTGTMRVAEHAYDKSYVRMFLTLNGANVSIAFSDDGAGRDLGTRSESAGLSLLAVPAVGSSFNVSDFAVVLLGSFAWGRAGTAHVDGASGAVRLAAGGNLRSVSLHTTRAPLPGTALASLKLPTGAAWDGRPRAAFTLGPDGLGVGDAATASAGAPALGAVLRRRLDAELATYAQYGALASTKRAAQAGVMWCLLFVPSEYTPFAPVSRSWGFLTPPRVGAAASASEWVYVIFDWDNIFASYMFGLDHPALAASNLIQVIKSKTAQGFVPNFSSAGEKSADRTEPMIGARVLKAMYDKHGAEAFGWVVDLLLEDVADWHDWFHTYRTLPPAGLLCLGSSPVPGDDYWSPNTLKSAMLESGLDNSPMWDGTTFDTETHQMQLYELSASSLFVAEGDRLAALASAVGRAAAVAGVQARADAMRALVSEHMWDDAQQVFTNKFPNGSFYRRISPTSFYPLIANASTDAQAEAMVSGWLTNKTRFCISDTYETTNSETCYWGLPSISADDPAFPPLGYWRGYVWGPMAQLTYWGLQQYDHVPAVRAARKALTKQMTAMFLNQWNKHAHVCENFNPHKNGTDCTGTKFYHWGALAGMISIEEAGMY
eukprot:g362.t1